MPAPVARPTRWPLTSRMLHAISALAVFGMFASGWWMTSLGYYDSWYHRAPWWHKSFGLTLLALTLWRVITRLLTTAPPAHGSALEQRAAHGGHLLLYILLFSVLLTGYLISTAEGSGVSVFGWFTVPALITPFRDQATIAGSIHWYCAWALVILATGHGLFALKHHFIDRHDTLTRMFSGRSRH
ncbi:cytochrome b [Larsenimonas rhizosphaerae]|uniref:Cytochrome b n=1 Tax=Larsenimonas rhizosphaerae TaxID=2944682 RepID=A0AA41ZI11_9GAMM|nr:cytochrome b [Larsenimonas rhizosphaerae]MCM2129565.1 cytochrome b [Larsenimonas rhizosphaerae]MCX2524223.1 cytochrome b [Larsenimonas rhizosphaerae]